MTLSRREFVLLSAPATPAGPAPAGVTAYARASPREFFLLAAPPTPANLVPVVAAGLASARRSGADPDFATSTRAGG